ncbi:MAG: hypothetical protein ACTSWN_05165 [Promethearchaeota archaeon]
MIISDPVLYRAGEKIIVVATGWIGEFLLKDFIGTISGKAPLVCLLST